LLKEGSVTRTAAVLGRSPPAISAALAQMRILFNDPLFVRVGGQLQPTARAAQLATSVEELCQQLEGFFSSQSFRPDTAERKFVIASTDSLVQAAGWRFVTQIRQHAPHMSLHFAEAGLNLVTGMCAREIDFALMPDFVIDSLAPAPLRFEYLQTIAVDGVLMSVDHPLAQQGLISADDLRRYSHIGFRPDPLLLRHRPRDLLDGIDVAVGVSQNFLIPSLMRGTDLIAYVTKEHVVHLPAEYGLKVVDLERAVAFRLGISWGAVFDHDPAHLWFRKSIIEAAAAEARARSAR
jgi:DNA-binding transcriptional LysR family regulator